MTSGRLTRRGLAAVAGIPVLAACGPEESTGTDAGTTGPTGPTDAGSPTPTEGVRTTRVASTDQVPVGGGVVLSQKNLVTTQPTAGEFRAFSATCSHAGCQMASVTDRINCGCHGSTFALADGANTAGPNGSAAGSIAPLTAKVVVVRGDDIRVEL